MIEPASAAIRVTAAADAGSTHQRVGVCDCVWVR